MAMRYEHATELYNQTLKKISHDENSWTAFLKSASKNYRLSFADMVMLYAQRPEATAVLEMEEWNKRYGLWIKPGSKGIAVFDSEHQGSSRLKYYFDISDTRTTEFHRPVPIWVMRPQYEMEVIETLSEQFGPFDKTESLGEAIISAVNSIVEDNMSDYLKDFTYSKTDSYLDGLDELSTAVIYQSVLTNSIAYSALSRCGLHAEDYINVDSLRQVAQFNTIDALNALGVPAKDMSQMIIGEIRKSVLMQIREENVNRTFVTEPTHEYNDIVKAPAQTERSLEHNENRIFASGRISDSQPDIGTGGRDASGQIRINEEKLSQEAASNSIHELSDSTDLEPTFDGDRPDSKSTERAIDLSNDATDGRNREVEGNQSDGMDTKDESDRGNDTRTDHERIDLQLNAVEQAGIAYQIPAFFTLEEYEELIKYDRFHNHKNKDIQRVFEFYDDSERRVAYIKESFTKTIIETIYQEERLGFQLDEDKDALKVWKGSYLNPDHEAFVSWEDVTSFIEDMIERNIYLSIPLKPIPTTDEQQLNLFDMLPVEPTQTNSIKAPFTMPQHIVDTILADGIEEKNSKMKIAVFFSLDLPIEENVMFLKDLYGKGSNGFLMEHRNVSYIWDNDGFQITWGKGIVNSFNKHTLSWEEVAKGIHNLLDTGRYMSQLELDQCDAFEYQQVAEKLWYMCQDMDFDETDHMMELRQYYKLMYPKGTEKIAESLRNNEFYEQTMNELYSFNKDYQSNPQFMRHGWTQYAPDNIIPVMENLKIPHVLFKTNGYQKQELNYFITQDTIDTIVSYDHRTHQKYDTYAFFSNHSDKKERINFLKQMWGDSGSNHYTSSAKGLNIKTGSYNNPYAEVLLKWKDVEQRTSELISSKRYFTAHEMVELEHYECEHIMRDIRMFFHRLPFHNIRPYDMYTEYYDDNKDLVTFIMDRDNVKHILDLMQIALNNTDPSDEHYGDMQEYRKHVQEYYYGTYSLFNEKKEPIITEPYEPTTDIKESLARLLTSFMEEFDAYEFRDQYDVSHFDEAVNDTHDMLFDISRLEDIMKFMNEAIYESDDLELSAKAVTIREEISVLYALQRGSDLSDGSEIQNTYRPFITQEQPHYNTGDFVFFKYESKVIYGTIELIDEDDTITIEIFSHDLADGVAGKDVEINKVELDKILIHDYRNRYFYDPQRVAYELPEEQGLQVLSNKDRNTLGYQNYKLLSHIAPMMMNGTTEAMQFSNAKQDTTISIAHYPSENILKIQEVANDDFKEYVFALDISFETLDIREITVDDESETLELVDGEVEDYEIELQMNEDASDYMKTIADRGFHLQAMEVQIGGKNIRVTYQADGNIQSFDGDTTEFDYFMKHYANDPIQKVSSLVPLSPQGKDSVHKVEQTSIAQKNYQTFKQIAPMILTGDSDYMHFVGSENMMPLTIEVFEDRIMIAHTFELNGDLPSDPLMEFVFDNELETMNARSYEQSLTQQYRDVRVMDGEVEDEELEDELNKYAGTWFQNIIDKEYQLETVRIYADNSPIDVNYGADGHILSFSGTNDDLTWFQEQFADEPSRVSILIPEVYEEDSNIEKTPSQKETVQPSHSAAGANIATHKLYPKFTEQERHNFKITDFALGAGGLKEKYKANIEAIKLLKQLKQDERLATPQEQEILSRYVGWGALPDAFDDSKSNWKNEYQELKELLNDTEYKAARESTLTAFYTPPVIIEAIYQKLMDMGLKEGNLLEPSCGVGNFMGMQPDNMDCTFYGVELDTISGQIAQQLYQKATIAIQGFERTEISDNLFDAVVGNVPYGQIPVFDPKYSQQHFMIHDYYFAKALDKVKTGGIVIFLTSKFTMDKRNHSVRKYIAQRANLLGAIRLPDNAFKANAGTEVTSDILILQKRERPIDYEPEWLDVMSDNHDIVMNSYFVNHPEMVLGTMVEETSQYGLSTNCKAIDGADLKEQLAKAMSNVHAQLTIDTALYVDEEDHSIPADPTVRNFSYCNVDGNLYYRENSRMYPYATTKTGENRIKGMIQIRSCMRTLIEYQTQGAHEDEIQAQQQKLHHLYDPFVKRYGLLNSRANRLAFQEDSSYNLICSLEVLNEDRSFKRKADIFDKITIKPRHTITSVKTASEALTVSMAEQGRIDFNFMTKISNISKQTLIENLQGVIYPNPEITEDMASPIYQTADEYLSGDIREKLIYAKHAAKQFPQLYERNIIALESVQPERIKAGDISVRLGTTWIPIDIYRDFMYQLLDTPKWYKRDIDIFYVSSTQEWSISRKSLDRGVKATKTYGTNRISGYKIVENTLNLRDVKIFDKQYDEYGKEIRVLNKKETAIAQDKQDIIKSKFIEWVWKDPERRERLCEIYNEKYNSIRNRTYDGSNLSFTGINPEIDLREHQKNAIARILYGGNTLLAHCVGAGKTFEMIAAGMESKRLGLCHKPIYVVPNNIIGDFASDFYKLYPSANILVATTDTLSKANRHKFFSRVATGDWDGVIVTHSQFIKMPVSQERQKTIINRQVEEISSNVEMLKEQDGERFTIKQLEKMKQKLEVKLQKLNDSSKKDDILCFEQLGIDMMFVDEADLFKNLFIYSKMRNVSGISQTDSQRASDLFMKTQYLDELTGYRGVVFATGTAISNSMSELYTMQRYLQYDTLQKYNLESFDAWASTFGETVTAMELAPEGSGFKMKTRFSKFYNLPELMTIFREVADIQTADMLNLPVPKAHFDIVSAPASEEQKEMIIALGERAEKVRNREVQPNEDNMLKITNDGRKIALDQRMVNPLLPEYENSKVNACVDNIYDYWNKSADIKGTQLMFCDLSTPTKDSKGIIDMVKTEDGYVPEMEQQFTSVYDEVKRKLVRKGIPSEQIAYIHDANNDVQKKELFTKVRQGSVRVLLGSTSKMGAGTNVQDLIVALHDLDCPWRPRDLEQRQGRGVRQGNINTDVHVIRYITEGTFDAYLYQTIEKKQQFISQILTGKTPQRSMEEIDEAVLNYAEIKAIACGDPKIMERCNLEMEVNKLNVLKASFLNQKYELQDSLLKSFPRDIAVNKEKIRCFKKDITLRDSQPVSEGDDFIGMKLDGVIYTDKADAGEMLIQLCKKNTSKEPVKIGEYRSFDMLVSFSSLTSEFILSLEHEWKHSIIVGTDKLGNITRINNVLGSMDKRLDETEQELSSILIQYETAKVEVEKPFERENELQEKTKQLAKLTIELKLDKQDPNIIDGDEIDESEMEQDIKSRVRNMER